MAKEIAKLLRTEMAADVTALPMLAKLLQAYGRKGDKVLAHITPEEAQRLEDEGGSGTINPHTGLPEYFDGEGGL
jgi:methylmalonyl-CoA mutase cobalamin-binding subunit